MTGPRDQGLTPAAYGAGATKTAKADLEFNGRAVAEHREGN